MEYAVEMPTNGDFRRGGRLAKLLIIEDDVTMLDLLRVHLKAAGHAVRVASDAAEGIRAILAETPDLVLSDIAMPYLDGIELLRALRSDPMTMRIPVIFLTGRDDDDTLVKAHQLGVDDFLTKPIQVEDLLSAIDKALKKSRPNADLRPLN
jgi:DNA-binding response OmpR family regulator